jgi:hypothetical protein
MTEFLGTIWGYVFLQAVAIIIAALIIVFEVRVNCAGRQTKPH